MSTENTKEAYVLLINEPTITKLWHKCSSYSLITRYAIFIFLETDKLSKLKKKRITNNW